MLSISTPVLPWKYGYKDFEDFVGAETMKLHFEKHHMGYVNNLNKVLLTLSNSDNRIVDKKRLREDLLFNGGGHVNHSIFWRVIHPGKSSNYMGTDDKLKARIEDTFGSFGKFCDMFKQAAIGLKGSGWCWLLLNKSIEDKLLIVTTANQMPILDTSLQPIIGLDMWEHAYYLKFKNDKGLYVDSFLHRYLDWIGVFKMMSEGLGEEIQQLLDVMK